MSTLTRRSLLGAALAAAAVATGCASGETPPTSNSESPGADGLPDGNASLPPLAALVAPKWVEATPAAVLSQHGWYWWAGAQVQAFAGRFWTMATKTGGNDSLPDTMDVTFIGVDPENPADIVTGPTVKMGAGGFVSVAMPYPNTGQFYLIGQRSTGDPNGTTWVQGVKVSADGKTITEQPLLDPSPLATFHGGEPVGVKESGYYADGRWKTTVGLPYDNAAHNVVVNSSNNGTTLITVDGKLTQIAGTQPKVITTPAGVVVACKTKPGGSGDVSGDVTLVDWKGKARTVGKGFGEATSTWSQHSPNGRYVSAGSYLLDTQTGKMAGLSIRKGDLLGITDTMVFAVDNYAAVSMPLAGLKWGELSSGTRDEVTQEGFAVVAADATWAVLGGMKHLDETALVEERKYVPADLYLTKIKN